MNDTKLYESIQKLSNAGCKLEAAAHAPPIYSRLNSQRPVLVRARSNCDQISILLCNELNPFEGAFHVVRIRAASVASRSSAAADVSLRIQHLIGKVSNFT
ncbi:unnamed protein product [Danaus chrysippus]|uniref:(African queen) hypothetical protein n=1 Tax=Danaus chrysippus TaxID=151541 RepID=A0A8J2QHT9_9NEOP|nr:unnamed protein product [Danaus chrysippus]